MKETLVIIGIWGAVAVIIVFGPAEIVAVTPLLVIGTIVVTLSIW